MIAEFNPEKVKVIVFDVDDTLARSSLGLKTETWKDIFHDRLDALQEAREVYEFTGKGDRYNIIAHIIGESQEGCKENTKVLEYAARFEAESLQKIREAGLHPNDLAALIKLRSNFSGVFYLLSATPEDSLQGNISHFEAIYPEIAGMFTGVVGMPMRDGKAGELTIIATENNLTPEEVLMVGDGGSDYNGATGSGSQFVAVVPEGSEKWADESFPKIASIAGLPQLINL